MVLQLWYVVILILQILPNHKAVQIVCSGSEREISKISLTLSNRRNVSGEWVTWFSASQNYNGSTKTFDVDIARSVSVCQGSNLINIQGFIKDSIASKDAYQSLRFHNRCSKNAAITNSGRTLQRLKKDATASGITNRPLLDNKVFIVRFDKRANSHAHALGIGVTTYAPDKIELSDHLNSIKSGTWMFYHSHIYHNSDVLVLNILKTQLNDVKVGQTIGVMRSDSGTLHFFIDGVDQGPAASNLPDTVYGLFELYSDALQGTIVDP